jgi:hypothetical protein
MAGSLRIAKSLGKRVRPWRRIAGNKDKGSAGPKGGDDAASERKVMRLGPIIIRARLGCGTKVR